MARFCTTCGTKAEPEDRFCGTCGAALRATHTDLDSNGRTATGTDPAGAGPTDRETTGRDDPPAETVDTPDGKRRDVFISYAEEDLTWAEWIGWHLEEATFKVMLQAWDSVAGRNWVADLDDGIRHTDYMVVVASTAYFSSPRTLPQWTAVVAGGTVPLIPVCVEDIQIPGLLAPYVPIALADKDEDDARTALLDQMRNVLLGRAKPTDPPRLPIPTKERAVRRKPSYPPLVLIAELVDSSTLNTPDQHDDNVASSGGSSDSDSSAPSGDTASNTQGGPAPTPPGGTSPPSSRPWWQNPHVRALAAGIATVTVAAGITAAVVLPSSNHREGTDQLTSGLGLAPATASSQPAAPAVLALPSRNISGSSNSGVTAPVFAPDGRTVAVGYTQNEGNPTSSTGGIYLVDRANPAQPRILGDPLTIPGDQTESAAFSPDGHTLAIGGWEGNVALWDVSNTAQPRSVGQVSIGSITRTLAFSPDGHTLAAGDERGEIHLWDVTNPAGPAPLGPPLTDPPGSVMSVAFSPDGHTLAAGTTTHCGCTHDGGEVFLWNLTAPAQPTLLGQPLTATLADTAYVSSVAFSPDGHTLAAASYSNEQIVLWNVTDPASPTLLGAPLRMPTGGATSVAFSPDGHTLAGADQTDVYLWDVTTPASPRPHTAPTDSANMNARAVVFSPDGHTLASSTYSGDLYLWTLP